MPNQIHTNSVPETFDRLLTDSGHEALVLHAPSGLIHFASPTAARLVGIPDLTGSSLLDIVHDADRADLAEAFRDAVIRRQQMVPRTVRVGERHIVVMTLPVLDIKGGVVELQTTLRDVTEFVRLRDRIQEHEAVMLAACQLAHVGGWAFDADHDELYWSDEVRRIHEVPKNFVPTVTSAIEFYASDHRHVIEDAVRAGLEEGRRSDVELPLITFSGRHIWVRVSVMPASPGEPSSRIYGAFQDITDLYDRERRLEDTVRTLSRKTDQLEEFAYVISHHLRGPVTNIVSLLDSYDVPTEASSELSTMVEHLHASAHQLLDTFEDLAHVIAARHQDVPNLESLVVADVVDAVSAELRHILDAADAHVSVDSEALPTILYPRVYLETIIRQLLTNAIRYAAPGRPPRIRIRTELRDGHPIIEVSDNGLGIDLERYGSKLFKIRSSIHRGSQSRGIGLYLVRSIVESMGGDVHVASVVDRGSTFTVDCTVHSLRTNA